MKPYSFVSMHKRFKQNYQPSITIPIQVTKPRPVEPKYFLNSLFTGIWDWVISLFSRPISIASSGNPFFFQPSKQESISNRTKLNMIRHGRWHGAKGKSKRIQMQGGI